MQFRIGEKTAKIPWFLIPYLTLSVSVIYYISNFNWGTGVESFKGAVLVWPFVVATGAFLYLMKFIRRLALLDFSALYVGYSAIVVLLVDGGGFRSSVTSLIYTFLWFCLLICGCEFSRKGKLPRIVHWVTRGTVLISAICFLYLAISVMSEASVKVLNPVFYLLYFLPFLFLDDNKAFTIVGVLLVFCVVIVSYKRTAAIIILLCLAYWFYRQLREKKKKAGKTLLLAVVVCLIGVALYSVIIQRFGNIDWLNRMAEIEETGGSGRTMRWATFLPDMANSSFLEVVFGHGTAYLYYHNDFMQVLYDFGIVGAALYSGICFLLLHLYFRMKKAGFKYTTAYGISLIVFFFNSAVGQVIVVHTWFLQMAVFWGLVIGQFMLTQERTKNGAKK